jgi:protein-S-isoprenylcysteine O-methyltransferase Ste14
MGARLTLSDDSDRGPSRLRATIGTVFFVILVPGTVIGWVPYEISGWRVPEPFLGLVAVRWLGAVLFVLGLPVFVDFLVRFVIDGIGTPAPIAEPRRLVVSGVFRWVRNPGYVAVVAMLVGQGLFFGSAGVLVWALGAALAFHLFVVLYEEPHLRREFGAEYEAYCAQVPRWLPGRAQAGVPKRRA